MKAIAALILFYLVFSFLGVLPWFGPVLTGVVLGEVFIFGTFWFWMLMLAMSAGIIYLIDEDLDDDYTPGWTGVPFGVFFVAAALLQFFGNIPVFTLIAQHPVKAAVWVLAYMLVGVAYSFGRWTYFLHAQRPRKYRDENEKFFRIRGLKDTDEVPAGFKPQWDHEVFRYAKELSARDYKGWLIKLMAYWPWSGFWFLVSDFIKNMFRNIYELLQDWYDEIAKGAWRRMEKEVSKVKFAPPEEKEKKERGNRMDY